VYAAYLDESGKDGRSPVIVVAGYLSRVQQWTTFCREWRELLDDHDLESFHMTDFERGGGPFSGWSDNDRHKCLQRAYRIIADRTFLRISIAMHVSEYEEVFRPAEASAYGMCVVLWMQEIERQLEAGKVAGDIAYFFDRGSGFEKDVVGSFDFIRSRPDLMSRYRVSNYRIEKSFKPYSFVDKRKVLPIQAADMFAYETWKQITRVFLPEEKSPVRKSLVFLLSSAKHHAFYHGREHLQKMKRDQDAFVDPHARPGDYA